nr:unnamed protein product [Callosobruchus analis]
MDRKYVQIVGGQLRHRTKMKSYPYIPSMVQAITVLTVLKMMTKAQTSCGSGATNGKLLYERLPNIQLQGFDDDVVRDSAPPFAVLEKCQDLCMRDRSSNNIVRACSSFDFQPGSRIASYSGAGEYEESTCYLTAEQAQPEGIGNLILMPNSVHFTEVCITSNRPERECPNRRYVFERHPRKKLKLPTPDIKEVNAANRTECEDKCLNEFSFVCRSATFDAKMRMCTLSRFTRRTHPELLVDDRDSDYLENTCLNADRRCDGLAVFIKEENKRLGGPFEAEMFTNLTLEDCQAMCVRAEKYFCRSIEYDEMTKQCTLSEEDSISQKDDLGTASSPSHNFYDFACLDSPRGQEYPDNSVTSHLFSGKKPDTAFQRYRNSRLGGEHHSEISGRSLSECLDECLRQPSFQCRSAEYSERYRTCRLTRYNQKDGMRIIYDADYDYYENLMLGGEGEAGTGGRPGEQGYPGGRPGGRYPPVVGPDRYPPGSGGIAGDRYPPPRYPTRYPDDRYPPVRRPRPPPPSYYNRYPDYDDKYQDGYGGRHPSGGGSRYQGRYPEDRYPPDRRYPYYPPSGGGDRYYPSGGGRYGSRYGNRYDDYYDRNGGRHGVYDGDRYPGDRYGNRYDDEQFGSRYGGYGGRYGSRFGERFGGGTRYNDRYNGNRFDYYDDRNGAGGTRWSFRPDRRPAGRPVDRPPFERPPYDRPHAPNRRPISPGPDGPIYENYGGGGAPVGPVGVHRPALTRCGEEGENFKQVGFRQRMRKEFIKHSLYTPTLRDCERECVEARDFICRSFNYKDTPPGGYDADRDNCELSDRDSRDFDISNLQYFDNTGNYDFYERSNSRDGLEDECLDVTQVCNEDGMEFTLVTPEGFYGRIYTYGFYDRCFFRGNGGTVNVLRISGAGGYPECGTQRYGDTMTNIAVVQFADNVQTGRDKRFNLTCLFRGPGEAVVTSGFIGAGSGSPIPIEYLPAENTLSSKVRLLILYQGRPTTTIAVGDPLTFRLEAQDGYNYATDIFATNVVARDPYSGRSVQLIDKYGCPVDPFVFPELDKGRNGDTLEARFNAFKIPESNFLVFEATVRTCRDGCQPAYCQTGTGRSEPSFGRRRRDVNATLAAEANDTSIEEDESLNEIDKNETTVSTTKVSFPKLTPKSTTALNDKAVKTTTASNKKGAEENEEVISYFFL